MQRSNWISIKVSFLFFVTELKSSNARPGSSRIAHKQVEDMECKQVKEFKT